MRAAPVLLVALLVVPAAAVAAPDGSRSVGPPDVSAFRGNATQTDGIAILTIGSPSNAVRTNGSLDVAAALALDRAKTEIRLEQYAFEARVRGSENPGQVVEAALNEIRNRSVDLRESERALWRRYANGSIATTTFLRGLAETSVRARALRTWLDRVAASRDIAFLRNPVLTALSGPVRARIAEAVRGNATEHVYVQASPNGIALATITDGRYVREAYRIDQQSLAPEALSASELELPVLEWYGLSEANTFRRVSRALKGDPDRFTFAVFRYGFTGGSISAYLDGGTEEVFHEVQTRVLARMKGGPTTIRIENGTRLLLNRSYPGGPLRIATYDNDTGVPVSSTVIVGDHRLETGSDGIVWTLTPPGGRFSVTAIRPDGRVSGTFRPIDPVPLGS